MYNTEVYFSFIEAVSQEDLSGKIDIENDYYLSINNLYILDSVSVDFLSSTGETSTYYVSFLYNY